MKLSMAKVKVRIPRAGEANEGKRKTSQGLAPLNEQSQPDIGEFNGRDNNFFSYGYTTARRDTLNGRYGCVAGRCWVGADCEWPGGVEGEGRGKREGVGLLAVVLRLGAGSFGFVFTFFGVYSSFGQRSAYRGCSRQVTQSLMREGREREGEKWRKIDLRWRWRN